MGGPHMNLASLTRFDGKPPAAVFGLHSAPDADARDAAAFVFPDLGAGMPIGVDDRTLVEEPASPPYSCVCAIEALAADGLTIMRGTGWLMGPRAVVTAAHCLYPRPVGSRAEEPEQPYHG